MPVCWLGSLRSACTSLRFSSRNLSVVSFHGGSPQVASAFGSTKSPEGRGSLQVASTHRSAGSPGGSGPEKEYRRRGASSMSSSELSNRMVWVDLEMTGLDIEKDQIIEMACVITDAELNVVAEGPNLVIKQPDQLLDGMSDWCKEHHGQVTLFMRTRSSWINTCLSSCSTSTIESSTSAPSRSSADGGSLKSTRWFLRRRPATEPWMTSRRASRSCSTTEPSSSKKPCSTEWVLQKIPEAKGTGRHKSTSAHLPHVSGAEDSLKDHHDATQPSIPLNPLDNLVRATGLWMFRQHQQQKT